MPLKPEQASAVKLGRLFDEELDEELEEPRLVLEVENDWVPYLDEDGSGPLGGIADRLLEKMTDEGL